MNIKAKDLAKLIDYFETKKIYSENEINSCNHIIKLKQIEKKSSRSKEFWRIAVSIRNEIEVLEFKMKKHNKKLKEINKMLSILIQVPPK